MHVRVVVSCILIVWGDVQRLELATVAGLTHNSIACLDRVLIIRIVFALRSIHADLGLVLAARRVRLKGKSGLVLAVRYNILKGATTPSSRLLQRQLDRVRGSRRPASRQEIYVPATRLTPLGEPSLRAAYLVRTLRHD